MSVVTETPCKVGERRPEEEFPPDFFSYFPAPSHGIQYPPWEVALKVTSYVILMLLGGIGNILVILIVVLNRRMRNKTNLYVANLAASDVMVSFLCMWVHLGTNIRADWPFTKHMCKVNSFFQAWSVTASVLFLMVISGDRFFAIVYPLHAKRRRARTAFILVSVMWLVSALVAGPHLFTWKMGEVRWMDRHEKFCVETWPRYYYETDDGLCLTHTPNRATYIVIHIAILYFLPVVVMTFAYVMIGRTLWKRKIPGEANSTAVAMQMKSKKRVVRMLIIVLFVFVVCWSPQQIIVLYDTLRDMNEPYPEYFQRYVKYVVTFVAYMNSAINPILYGALNENFRQGFREAFKCALCTGRNKVVQGGGQWTNTTQVVTVTAASTHEPSVQKASTKSVRSDGAKDDTQSATSSRHSEGSQAHLTEGAYAHTEVKKF